jgi:hypothetical protein
MKAILSCFVYAVIRRAKIVLTQNAVSFLYRHQSSAISGKGFLSLTFMASYETNHIACMLLILSIYTCVQSLFGGTWLFFLFPTHIPLNGFGTTCRHHVVIKIRQLFLRQAYLFCLTSTLLETRMGANDCKSRHQQFNVLFEAWRSSR